MSAETDLYEVAWEILKSGKDRVKRLPDKRRLSRLRRLGLIEYQDGYSVKARTMDKAAEWWDMVAREADRQNPARAAELREFAEKGREWAARHQQTPDLKKLKFGDLNFDLYHLLWKLVTEGHKLTTRSEIGKERATKLLRSGYVAESAPGTDTLLVQDKAKALVQEYGNPFLSQKTAAQRVTERFLNR